MSIRADHLAMLAASGITPEFAALRGYETAENVTCLQALRLAKKAQAHSPGSDVPATARRRIGGGLAVPAR